MKSIIAIVGILLTLNAFAAIDCASFPKELEGKSMINLYEADPDYPVDVIFPVIDTNFRVSKTQVKQLWKSAHDFELEDKCFDNGIFSNTFKTLSGMIYTAIGTLDDDCDGGNTYGVITDKDNNLIGQIGDSEFYCK